MRGITIAVFFSVCIITGCVAAPKQWSKNEISRSDGGVVEEGEGGLIYPSGRTRPSSPRRGGGSGGGQNGGQGPHLYFREGKSLGAESGPWGSITARPSGPNYWQPRYRIIKQQQGRDDEEEEGDDDEEGDEDDVENDIQDDEGSDEESFDTPSWDDIYPKEETGPYAQRKVPVRGAGNGISYQDRRPHQQQASSGYSLSQGSPGAPVEVSYRGEGRSGFRRSSSQPPRNWGPGNWGPESRRQVRQRGPVYVSRGPPPQGQGYEDIEGPPPPSWQGRVQQSSRWSSAPPSNWAAADSSDEDGPIYYQPIQRPRPRSRPQPQYIRRSWNWRPTSGGPPPPPRGQIQQIESDEEDDSGEAVWVPRPRPPQRRVKSWARNTQPEWEGGRRRPIQKWGYY